jgi:hypothetical protein
MRIIPSTSRRHRNRWTVSATPPSQRTCHVQWVQGPTNGSAGLVVTSKSWIKFRTIVSCYTGHPGPPIVRVVVDRFFREDRPLLATYDETKLRELQRVLTEEMNQRSLRRIEMMLFMPQQTCWEAALGEIDMLLQQRHAPHYDQRCTDVECSAGEVVNGFELYPVNKGVNIFQWELYKELSDLADQEQPDARSESAFADAMRSECCTDWHKQDIHGECYGGPWNAPEGSPERENAWELCMEQATAAMFRLPFSKDVLLRTIKIGCNNRLESVRYSNFLCVWIERKRAAMKQADKEVKLCDPVRHSRPSKEDEHLDAEPMQITGRLLRMERQPVEVESSAQP